jgi:response regulator of citrate/malate metabolism
MMNDLTATRQHLSRQLTEAVAADPIAALPILTALQKETEQHLREAVSQATVSSSWSEIATALGVSKQAAHQRFRTYAKDVAEEIKTHHRTARRARRNGDTVQAAQSQARRDELATQLRAAARALKDQT